ncbi:MAG: hypothetical protein GWP06_13025 [Actinobacteria bacterium]|nr:hypothetical protein [Actinomycetota bacterium]
MKDEQKNRPAKKTVLVLFPLSDLGQKIVGLFSQNGYRVNIILSNEKEQNEFNPPQENVSIFYLQAQPGQFWSNLADDVKSDILSAPVVIYCAGKDFLKMESTGKQEEWQIDFQSDTQKRLTFIDQLLSQFSENKPGLWINLAVGTTMQHSKATAYCKTRYGMIGFGKILELNPKFQGMTIRNICLSFFRHFHAGKAIDYCANCTTTDLRDSLMSLKNEDDLVRYLLNESEDLITRIAVEE